MTSLTVAEVFARACAENGVRRAFGVPGGGSSLDLIEAFAGQDIQFHLCRTETGAALAAAADGELRHGFGVAIATQGPGAASAMNGLAHSSLDRAPVLFVSDGWTAQQRQIDTHQVFDQRGMALPVVKAFSRLESDHPQAELAALIAAMRAAPWGPGYVELTGSNARRQVRSEDRPSLPEHRAESAVQMQGDPRHLLRQARRPVMVVGLEARSAAASAQVRAIARRLKCPVLTTYKAKGVVDESAPEVVGLFTGGAAEAHCLEQADLIFLCGLDPVELIGKPWPYAAPVLEVSEVRHPVHYVSAEAAVYGPVEAGLLTLEPTAQQSVWTDEEVARLRAGMRDRLACPPGQVGLSPQDVVELALAAARKLPEPVGITVDAGAHMFSAMAFWEARRPGDVLISNGLATMGFALPAGIARALHAPQERTIVFTGDGGLMMCAGELATAAQHRARLCVVVFNDAALSLIALKQRNRGLADAGVSWPGADFVNVARGFGLTAFSASDRDTYEGALRQALEQDGPSLIDVRVDPSNYQAQAKALRG